MKMTVLYMFLSGGAGTLANFLLTNSLNKMQVHSSMISFIINLLGCFLIGVFYVLEREHHIISQEVFLVLAGGALTGFTNYALFNLNILEFLLEQKYGYFIGYATLTITMGLCFTYAGMLATRGYLGLLD
jgi:fluoride exporter